MNPEKKSNPITVSQRFSLLFILHSFMRHLLTVTAAPKATSYKSLHILSAFPRTTGMLRQISFRASDNTISEYSRSFRDFFMHFPTKTVEELISYES